MKHKKILLSSGVILLGVCAYYHLFLTLYLLAGAFWGIINFYFIQQLVYGLLENPKKPFKIAMNFLIKFPVLYGLGFVLLYFQSGFEWAALAGFTGILLLSMQKNMRNLFILKQGNG